MTFFLVIDQVFRIFPLFSLIFQIFTLLDIVHNNPFLTRKHLFPILAAKNFFCRPITLLKILGGDECMGRPPTSNFGGNVPQSP